MIMNIKKEVKIMKSTGIVRKLDELGRLVLPKELRNTFDLNEKDPVEIFVEGDMIILKKFYSSLVVIHLFLFISISQY